MTVSIRSFARRSVGTIFVVSAPSGAGKTTLSNGLMAVLPDIALSVSYTTRAPREGEVPDRDYHFVQQSVFERMREAGEFAEWAEVHGWLYGTPRRLLEKRIQHGRDILLDIDVQGALSIKRSFPSAVLIFVLPPSFAELRRRLAARGTDKPDTIRRRLLNAKRELEEIHRYDYAIINKDLDQAVRKLTAIVMAERLRICRLRGRHA